jgi:hypothetical protein
LGLFVSRKLCELMGKLVVKERHKHVANDLPAVGGRIEVDSKYGECCNLHCSTFMNRALYARSRSDVSVLRSGSCPKVSCAR